MFTSKQTMLAREVSSAHAQLDRLLASRDSWYDGTIVSIDRRLAAVTNALPAVMRASAHDEEMLIECERLRREKQALHELRSDVLSRHDTTVRRRLPRRSQVGAMSTEARRFIHTELRHFLADNEDVIDDPDELDERAENYAELATLQMPTVEARAVVAHFRMAVNWASKPKRAPAPQQREASVDDLPDEMLFD